MASSWHFIRHTAKSSQIEASTRYRPSGTLPNDGRLANNCRDFVTPRRYRSPANLRQSGIE
jgi:hypothetical protein